MRGKVRVGEAYSRAYRITPAYAGKRVPFCYTSKKLRGSPPPMRGKVYAAVSVPDTVGITPAYAGKSCSLSCRLKEREDHPRLCGEKAEQRWKICRILGSPPPMRGKAARTFISNDIVRITPAYAGKRVLFPTDLFVCKDHPRLCGEKQTALP